MEEGYLRRDEEIKVDIPVGSDTIQSDCLDQYQWDPNPNLAREKPKHNMASHMADALRYALYSFQTSNISF